MTEQIRINSAEEAQSLKEYAAAALEREAGSPQKLSGPINNATSASIGYNGSKTTFRSGGPSYGSASSNTLPEGHVRLNNGMVTTREAAKAAGMLGEVKEDADNGNVPFDPKASPSRNEASEDNSSRATLETSSAESKASIEGASKALSAAQESIGSVAVDALQQQAAISGELPTHLPEGISQAQVSAVVAGYTAQANEVLKGTGANVDAVTAMLNPSELKEARIAAYTGDDARLRDLGAKAMSRLYTVPNDPALLSQLTKGWPEEVKVVRVNNIPTVKTPGWTLTWEEAVKQGRIGF
jgi:hypothetical protein